MKRIKKTVEEQLKEQGLHQVSINEFLYPKHLKDSKSKKSETTKGKRKMKCVDCRHFEDKGTIKEKAAYYCNYGGSCEFVCYGHPVKPIIPLSPKWCPMEERKRVNGK